MIQNHNVTSVISVTNVTNVTNVTLHMLPSVTFPHCSAPLRCVALLYAMLCYVASRYVLVEPDCPSTSSSPNRPFALHTPCAIILTMAAREIYTLRNECENSLKLKRSTVRSRRKTHFWLESNFRISWIIICLFQREY